MLKNIRLHIETDEQKQSLLDEKLADHIVETHNNNVNAFQRNIPSLLPYVKTTDLSNFSVFRNKFDENNIVDFGRGRTLYGFHPEQEVKEQLDLFYAHCPHVELDESKKIEHQTPSQIIGISDLASFKSREQQSPMPESMECLVVLGCGLALHLRHLIENCKIKNLIVYEPELQFFQCSIMVTDWQAIFSLAKERGTAIFLQLEKDGRDLIQDINELKAHSGISSFHLFKHYNHLVFNSLHKDLSERSWNQIVQHGFSIESQESYLDYLPRWTPNINLAKHTLLTTTNSKLTTNLLAFKKYFPDIYEEYKEYTPKNWLPITNEKGEVNILKIDSLHSWYGDSSKQDCLANFENFNQQPTKDGLALGYKGTKLAHYTHYKFVKETEELLEEAQEEVGALPDNVSSIIMFGLGVGYQLEKLVNDHSVEKLFICEPNRDFFYASLFAIDWQDILQRIEQSKSRIYLNIGDDGTNLFRDLLNQFYAIGPYILNSTYFYQSYYNASLNSAISQLREQLQVVISMGEYFDHAYYGISHTKEGLRRKIPVLAANPASKLSYDEKEVPVFIVGNGPSLDSSIESIKEWQGQAIVVSCGTALQALHRQGITPDFHAEIEQNRSTFDWAMLIGDLDYLKKITLISCNGIHPDTCDLYKDVMVAFKEGESSTVSATQVLGRENFALLLNAFPTVSNFAVDLFSTIGFTTIYLLGVDLGFVNVKHHHSKLSGYYREDGNETYDYAKTANTSLVVPGNFRATVNTKHEFKVSRQVIEQVTNAKPKGQEFFNCSDGAKIQGALPLRPNELLVVATKQQKIQTLKSLNTRIFTTENITDYVQKFENIYSNEVLLKEITALEKLLSQNVTTVEQAYFIINKQKEMLFASYKNGKSLLFYYLYGTINYANAVLVKLINNQTKSKELHPAYQQAKEKWLNTLREVKKPILSNRQDDFDISDFRVYARELKCLEKHCVNKSLTIVSDSPEFRKLAMLLLKSDYVWLEHAQVLTSKEYLKLKYSPDYLIIDFKNVEIPLKGKINTVAVVNETAENKLLRDNICQLLVPKLSNKHLIHNSYTIVSVAIRLCLSNEKSLIAFPKMEFYSNAKLHNRTIALPFDSYHGVHFAYYLCIYPGRYKADKLIVSTNGSRGLVEEEALNMLHLQYKSVDRNAIKERLKIISKLVHQS